MSAPAVAEKAKETDAAPPVRSRMPQALIKDEGASRRRFFHKAPPGTSKEDPLYPGWWGNVCRQLLRHDVVTLLSDDESWEAEYCVEAVRMDGAEVSVRKVYARKGIVAAQTPVADGFHTEWRPGEAWCVVRQKDGLPVVRGHALEASAVAQWRREQPRPLV
jgi:hypothetical protein